MCYIELIWYSAVCVYIYMLIKINIEALISWPASSGPWPPYFFEIIKLSEILMFCRKIFGLLVLKKIEVLNFVGKSFNLTPPTLLVPRRLCI